MRGTADAGTRLGWSRCVDDCLLVARTFGTDPQREFAELSLKAVLDAQASRCDGQAAYRRGCEFTLPATSRRSPFVQIAVAGDREAFDTLVGPRRCAHGQKNPRIASTVLTATTHWISTKRTSREINARRRCRSLLNLQYALANGSGAPPKAWETLGGVTHEERGVGSPAGRIRLGVRFMNAIPAHDAHAVETRKTTRFLAVLRPAGPTSTSRDDNAHR